MKLLIILVLILTLLLGVIPSNTNLAQTAQAKSKSSGNEVKRDIQTGLDLTGRTKTEVLELVGAPWQKDQTPVKARYTEKWIYSCETERGLTFDCVFIYFLSDRVKKVEIY